MLGIEQEKMKTNEIIDEVLNENCIKRDEFEKTLDMYKNDCEILDLFSNSEFEPAAGVVPNHSEAEEILNYEIECLNKSNSHVQKCQIEDEVWEKWKIEIGDIHSYCKNHPELKIIYLKRL